MEPVRDLNCACSINGDSRVSRFVYILAASHSGSTVLAMLLGAHSEVCTVGELKINKLGDVSCYRCSCGDTIINCAFWNNITANMYKRGILFDIADSGTNVQRVSSRYLGRLLRPLHRGICLEMARDLLLSVSPEWHRHLNAVQARNKALVEAIIEVSGKKVIVDSSKIGLRLKYLIRNPAFDIRVIHLVRDGRAVALTYMDPFAFADAKCPKLRGGGSGEKRDGERHSIEMASYEWRRNNEDAQCALATLPEKKRLTVHYEDLCLHTSDTLTKICDFIGVAPEGIKMNFREVRQHVIGNGMRLDTSSDIILDDRWKQRLTTKELSVFQKIAGGMNARYGYS